MKLGQAKFAPWCPPPGGFTKGFALELMCQLVQQKNHLGLYRIVGQFRGNRAALQKLGFASVVLQLAAVIALAARSACTSSPGQVFFQDNSGIHLISVLPLFP